MMADPIGNNVAVDKANAVDDSEDDDDGDFDPNNPNADQGVDASDAEAEPSSVESDDDELIDLAESNKEAEPVETDDDESNDNGEDAEDDDSMIALSEEEDCVLIDEIIQDRRDQINVESSEVIGGETISDERLKEMKDTFVRNSHTCQKVHKKSVIKI